MALTILQQPQALTFVGNIPELIVQTDGLNMTVNISLGGSLILSESYTADADGRVRVRLKDFLNEHLSFTLPAGNLFEQTKTVRQFVVELIAGTDTTEFSFVAIKGGVDKTLLDCAAYMKEAWLTWQPQTKHVRDVDPEWLSFFAVAAGAVKVTGYFSGGASETIDLHTLEAGRHYTMNMCFSDIREEFTLQPIYFDVWVVSGEDETYRQRYVLTDEVFDHDDLFVFENSVGGLDTIRLTGEKRAVNPVEVDAALFYDESTFDYQVNPNKAYEKNTGYFRSKEALYWAQDFFQALKKYLYLEEELIQIQLRNPEIVTIDRELVDFDFKFAYTKQTPYLALFKKKSPLIDPVIIGPGDEEYYLPPKISDFPQLDDPTNALFPVQVPGTPGWFFLTWTTMLSYIYDGLPPVAHNSTTGKQGGKSATESSPAEFYHLSAEEYEKVQNLQGGVNQETKFLSGGFWVYSGTGLIFDTVATQAQFPGSNDIITIPGTPIDLEDFPELDNGTDPQFVRPVWNQAGQVVPLFGPASSDPQVPSVSDPLAELAGDPILLGAGASSIPPIQIQTGVIFAEGAAGESTLGQSGAGTSNFASTADPIAGSISVEATNVQANFTTNATPPAPVFLADYTAVSIKIRLKAPMGAGHNLGFFFRKAGAIVTKTKMLPITKTSLDVQVLGIPLSQFESSEATVDQLVLRWYRSSGDVTHPGYFFDDWILQGGIQPPVVDSDGVKSVTGDGVGGTAKEVVMTFPTPAQIGANAELGVDINAALAGANDPDAANPFTTKNDTKSLHSTGSVIRFDRPRTYGKPSAPITSATLTQADLAAEVVQTIFHQASSFNPPSTWEKSTGSDAYDPAKINVIYAECFLFEGEDPYIRYIIDHDE